MASKRGVELEVPILGQGNRQQRRAAERAAKKGLVVPGQPERPAPPADAGIVIGHVTDENISHIFYTSMTALLTFRLPQIRNRVIVAQGDAGHLDVGRNKVVEAFLKTPYPWLLWIDTDMAFNPREFDLVFELADEEERPMVSALYFKNGNPPGPCAFVNTFHNGASTPADGMVHADEIEIPEDREPVEVDGVGFGFVLIHRRVFEEVAEEFGPTHPHRPWFDQSDYGPYSEPPSEDLSFCHRVRALNIPIWLHPRAVVGHVKNRVLMGRSV